MYGIRMEYWQGAWISDNKDINYRPAPYFRKVFDARKKIWSARAYIAVAGLYELYINGEKIGNHRLDPLYTRFDRRNFYVTYDITSQIQKGKMRLVCCWAMDGIIRRRNMTESIGCKDKWNSCGFCCVEIT